MSIDLLQEKIRKLKCPIVLDLSVEPQLIPSTVACDEENVVEKFCHQLLSGLKGVVPAVRFPFDQFALMGSDGLRILTDLLREAKSMGYYVLLEGPSVTSPWSAARAAALLEEESDYPCDSMIISPYIGSDAIRPFLASCKAGKSLFVIVRSPNKSAVELQDLMTGSRLVHIAAADLANRHGEMMCGKSGYHQIGAVTSATSASAVSGLRSKYSRMFLLVDGLDYPGGNSKNASCGFDRFGHGCAVSVGPAITGAWIEAGSDGSDYVEHALRAVERIRSNLNRYISIL